MARPARTGRSTRATSASSSVTGPTLASCGTRTSGTRPNTRRSSAANCGTASPRSWRRMAGCGATRRGPRFPFCSRASCSATMAGRCRRGTPPRRMAGASVTTCHSVMPRNTRAPRGCRDCLPQNSNRRCSTNCAPTASNACCWSCVPSRSSNKRRRWHERDPHPEDRRAGHR